MSQQQEWQRLDIRTFWIDFTLAVLCAFGLGWYLLFGQSLRWVLIGPALFVAGFLFFVIVDISRCLTTRFYISSERVELRYGLIWKIRRSIPRDRIRSVDVTSNPMYRIFNLAAIKLGTGQHAGNVEKNELALDALSVQRAEALQELLLQRSKKEAKSDEVLANFRPKGVLYAILSFSGLAVIGALLAGLGQMLEFINPDYEAIWREATRIAGSFSGTDLWITVTAMIFGIVILGSIISVLLFLENWSGYRFTRTGNGTLRLVRGLLFKKSLSIEERRVRGVEYSEPLQIRWARGAVLRVIVSGFGQKEDDTSQTASIIMPGSPRKDIDKLASQLLNESSLQLAALNRLLHKHPRAAFYRILVRRIVAVLCIIGILLVGSGFMYLPIWVWILAALLSLILIASSFDAYYSLGHAIRGRYLVVRRGSFLRRTAALQRSGIIGWKFRQSPLQRRLQLMTIVATTAAGRGAYKIVDSGSKEGIIIAQEAVPQLLDAFIERS